MQRSLVRTRWSIRFAGVAFAIAAASLGCMPYRVAIPAAREPARRGYGQRSDLESLQLLMGGLRLGMSEQAVRALLGEPDICPVEGRCYYSSDRQDRRGHTMTLVVEYRHDVLLPDREIDSVVSHRLESYSLGPVGE
jgi:hypothetical protein